MKTLPGRLPLPLVAGCVVACGALDITSRQAWVLPAIALAIVGAWASPQRFPSASFAPWVLRMVAFGAIALANSGKQRGGGADWLFEARAVSTVGELCAAELAIQCWRLPSSPMRHRAILLFLSGLVLLCGCNTFYDAYVRLLTPVYMLCAALALREVRPRVTGGGNAARRRQGALRFALVLLAVAGGAALQVTVARHRFDLTMFGMRLFNNRMWPRLSGISSQPRLGPSFEAGDSPQRVFRVEGQLLASHLRGMAFDTYRQGSWLPTLEARQSTPLSEARLKSGAQGERAVVTTYIDNNGLLFAPLTLAGLVPAPGSEVEWDGQDGGPLRTRDPAPYSYTIVQSHGDYNQGILCPRLTAAQRALCLNVPQEIGGGVHRLARDITRKAHTDAERARAIVGYLMRNYKYSQRIHRLGGDPVTIFLIERRAAHCEFFASGAVILLRCVGIPARYVVGYYAHESGGPGVTIVRQRDAHAWAECWIDGVGWVTVDATPGDGTPAKAPPPTSWQRITEWLQDRIDAVRNAAANLSREQLLVIAVVLAAVWMLDRWRQQRRRRAQQPAAPAYITPGGEFAVLARRFEAMLRRAGMACPEATPWLEHLRRPRHPEERGLTPDELKLAERFALAYNEARFGRGTVELTHVEEVSRELERVVRVRGRPIAARATKLSHVASE